MNEHSVTIKDIKIGNGELKVFGQIYKSFVYFLDGMLIDTGPSRLANDFTLFYQQLSIEQVVLTHNHEDHSGLAWWVQEKKSIAVYAHSKGIDQLKSPKSLPFYRKKIWGEPYSVNARALSSQIDTEKYSFRVIYTPGHSQDHVVLLDEKNGRLFAGDLYLGRKLKYILRGENVPQLMESIKKVLQYDFDVLFCGHAGVIKDGKDQLQSKLQFLNELQGHICDLREKGYSEWEINRKIYGTRWLQELFTGGESSSRHIIHSILYDKPLIS